MASENDFKKIVIGRNVRVDLMGHALQVPAKVDTGADSSSISASDVEMLHDGTLQFRLFDKESPFYDGKQIQTKQYTVAKIRSSTGHQQIRYQVILLVRVKGKRIKGTFNLSNRSKNHFPMLIGRRTLSNKFIVDVTMTDDASVSSIGMQTRVLNNELTVNPYAFYKKYHGQDL